MMIQKVAQHLRLKPHDQQINYVIIDLRHHY